MEKVFCIEKSRFGHSEFLKKTKELMLVKIASEIPDCEKISFHPGGFNRTNSSPFQQIGKDYLAQLQYLSFVEMSKEVWVISSEELEKNFVRFWSAQMSLFSWEGSVREQCGHWFRGCLRDQIDVTGYLLGTAPQKYSILLDRIGCISPENMAETIVQTELLIEQKAKVLHCSM